MPVATESISIKGFYLDLFGECCKDLEYFLDHKSSNDIGHFNIFNIEDLYRNCSRSKVAMPYNRRTYYKISLINGKNTVEYADKKIEIKDYAILFATPKIPYHYQPQDDKQSGHFCIFTEDFMPRNKVGMQLEDMPIFSKQSDFVYQINKKQFNEFRSIFQKITEEFQSDYAYKYDLIRNYVSELIHNGQKLRPIPAETHGFSAASRISSLFIELLERQFPIESSTQVLQLRTAKDYADMLRVHVNHLNKTLKETTGKTTTEIITGRMVQEAKLLLRQTNWNISEIAYCLGFEEVAHFSNFFKKQTQVSPATFRN